jgi:hypothetical protein
MVKLLLISLSLFISGCGASLKEIAGPDDARS